MPPPFYMFVFPPLLIHHSVDETPYKFRNYITQTVCLKSVKGFIMHGIYVILLFHHKETSSIVYGR